jgi:predicted O-linked N-acetylglucosamine transferase (SPINDLY family)
MRARHTVAILRRMGVADTVTESLDDYVSVAARLARDADWRKLISRRIAENKHRVYRDRACIVALEEFLDSVVRTGNPDRRGPA